MTVEKQPLPAEDRSMERPFGMEVYNLLLSRFGQPVLGNYQDIQKLKSADRKTTIALLFGPDASAADRLGTRRQICWCRRFPSGWSKPGWTLNLTAKRKSG